MRSLNSKFKANTHSSLGAKPLDWAAKNLPGPFIDKPSGLSTLEASEISIKLSKPRFPSQWPRARHLYQ